MKFSTLPLIFSLTAGVLTACGGGGGANSPDRPSPQLDKTSLELVFYSEQLQAGRDSNGYPQAVLFGSGKHDLQVVLQGTQTDGVRTNLEPILNVSASATWTLTDEAGGSVPNVRDEVLAEKAASTQSDPLIGDHMEISSKAELTTSDTQYTLRISAKYEDVTKYGTIKVIPPQFKLKPRINNPSPIFINHLEQDASEREFFTQKDDTIYKFEGADFPGGASEDQSSTVRFCSNREDIVSFQQSNTPGKPATATISSPFTDPNDPTPESVSINIYTVAINSDCDSGSAIAEQTVTITPATLESMDICAIVNPTSSTCKIETGSYVGDDLEEQCRGLDQNSIAVPAAQKLQMVARLNYTIAGSGNIGTKDLCFTTEQNTDRDLQWAANSNSIFSTGQELNATGGATLLSRDGYKDLTTNQKVSTVTARFFKDENLLESDQLTLNLVDAEVTALEIVRTDGVTVADGENDYIGFTTLGTTIPYQANCTYSVEDGADITEPCNVAWSLSPAGILVSSSSTGTTTVVREAPNRTTFGQVSLKASINDGFSQINAIRLIDTAEDELLELHLLRDIDGELSVDTFSCLGRDDLTGSLADGTNLLPGSLTYQALAKFNSTPTTVEVNALPKVTAVPSVMFTAVNGYSDGEGGCVTSPDPSGTVSPDDNPFNPGPAASFGGEAAGYPKNELRPNGFLRLNTVCLQSYVEIDGQEGIGETDISSAETTTVLVLPVEDETLLTGSNGLCEQFETAIAQGVPVDQLFQLFYGLGYIGDTVLSQLDSNVPTEDILAAIISGEFSTLNENFPDFPAGLGTITSALIGDEGALTTLIDQLTGFFGTP
ncbi:hypothetical protein IB286_04220 [Spongiibacter sp. KMU-158]|uniref:Lipoprotein n=1 Tax=Spongiibacter pelagi TaxID=2760804 RepID=A0A927C012_9GAMM|nr:hypothetical protein [Spongiibacter pelagi]MBD2858204.1 hypothetical protein [Spongiibacter pelagi]